MNKDHIYAISSDGTWFNTPSNLEAYHVVNPTTFCVKKGDTVKIQKKSLLSLGTEGVVTGFDRSSTGKILLLISWDHHAAPLRVGIEAIMPSPPAKFWMVIPFNIDRGNGDQSTSYNSDARRSGTSPAVHRFATKVSAERYIRGERQRSRFLEYVILESVEFNSDGTSYPIR